MEPTITNLKTLQSPTEGFNEKTTSATLSFMLGGFDHLYLKPFELFHAYYNMIPNSIQETDIDCKKASKWFLEIFREEIKDCYYSKINVSSKDVSPENESFFMLYEDLIVCFCPKEHYVGLLFRKTDPSKIEDFLKGLMEFKIQEAITPRIWLLTNSSNEIGMKHLNINKPILDIKDNYNEDFDQIHQIITDRLNTQNDKGLVLLHGKPGTGKTSYIRYLISSINKEAIFLPPNMASVITNPELLNILIRNPNTIFVVEDAENIIIDRDKNGYSPVSALLNLTDGLLSDCLNIQIICTFNTDISKVDNALLRKGRLIAKYEFKELETAKANVLSKKLGFDKVFESPVPLSDIYNSNDLEFKEHKYKKEIGFKTHNGTKK